MKVLIGEDKAGFLDRKRNYEVVAGILQTVINAYGQLNLPPLTIDEFQKLFSEPDSVMYDKITGGKSFEMGGIKLEKSKVMEIMQKPAGYGQFVSLVKETGNKLLNTGAHRMVCNNFNARNEIKSWFLLDGGNIVTSPDALNKLAESFKFYATSEVAKKINEFANTIVDAYNRLGIKHYARNPNGFGAFLKEFIDSDYWDGNAPNRRDIVVRAKGIMDYNNQ